MVSSSAAAPVSSVKDPAFRSLHEFFLNAANNIWDPSREYLFQKLNGEWKGITYATLLSQINELAAWMLDKGLEKGDRVALLLENSPQFYVIDQALQKLGLVNVSIYPTLTADETAFILNDSGARLLIVGNTFLYKKFLKVATQAPAVMQTLCVPAEIELQGEDIYFNDALAKGRELLPSKTAEIENRFAQVGHDDLATLIYTSGTTGVPKGAMLTHYNFMSNCYDAKDLCPAINKDDLFLSFLPLSHVFERMATYYLSGFVGAQVAFAENIEKVSQNIQEMRPTVMACIPRLLEKVHDKVYQNATAKGGLSAMIFHWSIRVGERMRKNREQQRKPGLLLALKYWIAEKLVFSKVKAKMGGRMRLFVSGGGALPPHVGEFFANLGLKVQEGYGLTETSPFITVNEFDRQVYGTVGRVAPRQQVAIQDIESGKIIAVQGYFDFEPNFESGEGEILAKGPNIMKGYWQNQAETDHVFDGEGWFHTGDIGKFEQGYLKITDRLKNMLKTSLGKNIYPTQVENNYLKSPRFDQIFVIGDKKEFLTAIIVPNLEELQKDLHILITDLDTNAQFIQHEKVREWIMEDVKKLSNNLAKFERIKDFVLKLTPFSIEDGEMTISLKIKRKIVLEKYMSEVEKMYV